MKNRAVSSILRKDVALDLSQAMLGNCSVFRTDGRSSTTIYSSGFEPRGDNDCLESHIVGCHSSHYVSFTKDLKVAANHAIGYSYLYQTNYPAICVNIPASPLATTLVEATVEKEIASIGAMPPSDIYQSRKFMGFSVFGYIFIGNVEINSAFVPRDYTVEVLSANDDQASDFEKKLRTRNQLGDCVRYLRYKEAQSVVSALQAEFRHVTPPLQASNYIINTVPVNFDREDEIQRYVLSEYHTHIKKSDFKLSKTSFFMFSESKSGVLPGDAIKIIHEAQQSNDESGKATVKVDQKTSVNPKI